ncbi:MAG: cysteine--tRNA ligase, partial [Proteobacteria bacterium]|nr:cysteine--tRNA ligase [Pseudomonadota bacterium]
RNITDVDDKINARAQESGVDIREITEEPVNAYHADMASIGTLPPSIEPRATEHIPQMVTMIEKLIAEGHAYEADGHVLFNVKSDPDYGRLSGRSMDEMIAGARVEVAPYKNDPADFVLWKPSDADIPGWDSPWGRGRPGWHIECSAMGETHLGETFDIHGGGIDLIFPHHENEAAQSRCAHDGAPLANFWMHNGYLMVEGEKMSKSLGNFFTVRDVVAEWPGEVARYAMLATHYRQPLDWTNDGLTQAKQSLDRIYRALRALDKISATDAEVPDSVLNALQDDLNTPQALSALHDLTKVANKADNDGERARLKGEILAAGQLLGLLNEVPEQWLHASSSEGPTPDEIENLIQERLEARKNKDFARADEIRDTLAAQGIILEDSGRTTSWRRSQ